MDKVLEEAISLLDGGGFHYAVYGGYAIELFLTETYASMQTLTSRYIGMKGIGLFSTCSIWVDVFLSLLAIIWYTTLKT